MRIKSACLVPVCLTLLVLLKSLPVLAFDPITVKDIRVEGLQRIDPGTVFNYLPVKVGEQFDSEMAKKSVKALFDTGFFNDIRIEVDDDILIVAVNERPTIAQININGTKIVERDKIRLLLKTQNFSEGRIFQQSVLDMAINETKKHYYTLGYYSVIIKPTVTKLERNRVGIQLDIAEGKVARIQQINIVGNKVVSEKELINLFSLTTPSWITWYTQSDQYSKQKMKGDLEKIQSYYQDRGYLDFSIQSTQISMSEDREKIYLTINLSEGDRYTVGQVSIVGDTIIGQSELEKLLELREGETFSREKMMHTSAAIVSRLRTAGYAFANVNPIPEINREKHIVGFIFHVDPGRKTFVRRINIAGNKVTRDEVIRRELRQMESAPYDDSKIKRSKERLDQLDYFNEVSIDTPLVPETADQVDMNVQVEEKRTAHFAVGVAYSGGKDISFLGSLSENNFMGSGKQLSLSAALGTVVKNYALSMANPYATPDGISFGWTAYRRETLPEKLDLGSYSTDALGGGFQLGLPVSETSRIYWGLNLEQLKVGTNKNTPAYIQNFVTRNGAISKSYTMTSSWGHDSRDSVSYPTKGRKTTLGGELAIPPSRLKYYKLSAANRIFFPMGGPRNALMWNLEFGYANSYAGSELPFYRNYYLGGIGSIRGFEANSLGPRDSRDEGRSHATGGNRFFVSTWEYLFPMIGMKDDRSLRLGVFYDVGALWGKIVPGGQNYPGIRQSAGLTFTWVSPMGPITMSIAKPLAKKPGDRLHSCQFQFGVSFD